MIVVTTDGIPGYRIEAVMGEVIGLVVRSANWGDNVGTPFRGLSLEELPQFTSARFGQRVEVLERIRSEAARRGANAVVGARFESTVAHSLSELMVVGVAVRVVPIPDGEPGATAQSAAHASGADPAGAHAYSPTGLGHPPATSGIPPVPPQPAG